MTKEELKNTMSELGLFFSNSHICMEYKNMLNILYKENNDTYIRRKPKLLTDKGIVSENYGDKYSLSKITKKMLIQAKEENIERIKLAEIKKRKYQLNKDF